MKAYGYKKQVKSKADLKGRWSRMETANFERKFKKATRQKAAKQIQEDIELYYQSKGVI